ncbi:MAG: hypothetical protein E6Y04_12015, partial [Corynebacterium sp.]|nr:hypothetical protein [Corynebacterium sp.]
GSSRRPENAGTQRPSGNEKLGRLGSPPNFATAPSEVHHTDVPVIAGAVQRAPDGLPEVLCTN